MSAAIDDNGTEKNVMEKFVTDYDVIVLGGGLAGLCLSIQLRRSAPDLRVLVLERGEFPRSGNGRAIVES